MTSEEVVLFVDDEANVLSSLQRNLIREPYRKIFVGSGAEALAVLAREPVQVIVSDMMMPEMDGPTLLRKVREGYPDVVRMVLSGTADVLSMVKAVNTGEIYRYVTKPLDQNSDFRVIVRQALEYARMRADQRRLVVDLEMRNQELRQWQERMAREMDVAARLQTRLLSTTPLFAGGYDVRVAYRPSLQIGGDFFDVQELGPGRMAVCVGDVAGHGVAPSMIAVLLKAIVADVLRGMADSPFPSAVCREINRRFREQVSDPDVYATLCLVFCDTAAAQWRVLNCGHPAPLLLGRVDKDRGMALFAQGGSLPLGVDARQLDGDLAYCEADEVVVPARPGDVLFLYTDGILESRRASDGATCGLEGIRRVLEAMPSEAVATDLPARLLDTLAAEGFDLRRDDCCALMVHVLDPANLLLSAEIAADDAAVAAAAVSVAQALRGAGWTDDAMSAVVDQIMQLGRLARTRDGVQDAARLHVRAAFTGSSCQIVMRGGGRPDTAGIEIPRFGSGIRQIECFRRGEQNVRAFVADRR